MPFPASHSNQITQLYYHTVLELTALNATAYRVARIAHYNGKHCYYTYPSNRKDPLYE